MNLAESESALGLVTVTSNATYLSTKHHIFSPCHLLPVQYSFPLLLVTIQN